MGTVLLLVSVLVCFAEVPAWWSQRSVLSAGAVADDFALVNQGQLKKIALAGFQEMAAQIPGGAGEALTIALDSWTTLNDRNVRVAKVTAAPLGSTRLFSSEFQQKYCHAL